MLHDVINFISHSVRWMHLLLHNLGNVTINFCQIKIKTKIYGNIAEIVQKQVQAFLRSCVAQALSRGDGPRNSLHASA